MNEIFADLIAENKVCIYIDDILIYSANLAKHCWITDMVLWRLRKHKLFLKLDKCEFEQQCIEYLGLIISEGKIEMDPVKMARVAEWPTSQSKKEVQQFMGFANFYWWFIKDYSYVARPLFNFIRNIEFKWEEQEQAFMELWYQITSTPILLFPNRDKPFQVEMDFLNFATRAVLSQFLEENGKWHPVAFYSKSLSAVEQNYNIYDKEMLAVI